MCFVEENTSSRFKNVYYTNLPGTPWKACTSINNTKHVLGHFATEIQAAEAVNQFCKTMNLPLPNTKLLQEHVTDLTCMYSNRK